MSIANGIFNATDYDPHQGTPKHPVCQKQEAFISNTELKPGKEGRGLNFIVSFTTQLGVINKNYTVEYPDNPEVERIARSQLSALCHATGQYQLSFLQGGMELRNKQCRIDVTPQAKDDKYNEVSKVYKIDGELPTRVAAAQAVAQPSFAPQVMQAPVAMQAPVQQFAAPAQAPQQFAPQPMQAPQFGAPAGTPMPDNGKPAWAR